MGDFTKIDFIGVGAQKSGTSWAYACLYEHPQICAPIKEIHFFSRPRFSEGKAWYESHFKKCAEGKLMGEFSTSYLYSEEAPARIRAYYPQVKLIAVLRNPIDRAYSQYRNSIKSGEVGKETTFEEFVEHEPSALAQGRYAEQLARYYALFPKEHILVLIYEDIKKDPVNFMKRMYQFIGVDDTFVASMIYTEINVARTPKLVWIDRVMHHVAEFLRRHGLDQFVHRVRQIGIPELIRHFNTDGAKQKKAEAPYDRSAYTAHFHGDVVQLSALIGRDMNAEWNI